MALITIISGTDRPGSESMKVARHIQPRYEKQGVQTRLVSMEDFPLSEVTGGRYGETIPSVEAFNRSVKDSDGVVFIVPEYNGSYPGILKMFIDYLPHPGFFDRLPVCFIGESAGNFGGLRPVEHLQEICNYRLAHVYPERVFITRIKENFDEQHGIKDEFTEQLLESQITGFTRFVDTLTRTGSISQP